MPPLDPSRSARLLAIGLLFAVVVNCPAETKGKRVEGGRNASDCVIVEYKNSKGGAYTWYYCPSSRIFVQPNERWITNFDTGIETRVLDKDRKVQKLPISVKQEWRRPELARRKSVSITPTGKTDVIAGVAAREYLFQFTYDAQQVEVGQWFATDMPVPGRDKAIASDIDTDLAPRIPPGIFLRSDGREATSVRRGTPPETVLQIPADYQKVHWSAEKNGWEADGG